MQKLKNLSLPSFATSSSNSAGDNTPPPLEPHVVEALARRRELLSALLAAVTVYHSTTAKVRPDPQRSVGGSTVSALPVQWLGQACVNGEESLLGLSDVPQEFAAYANSLRVVGEAQGDLGLLQQSFLDGISSSVLPELEQTTRDFKDFERKYKEAEKLRTTLESRISKKDKKSADGEAERLAELDYRDARESLERLAQGLLKGIEDDRVVLESLLDAQLDYALKQAHLLREFRAALSSTKPGLPKRASAALGLPRAATRMARSHSDSVVRSDHLDTPPSYSASHSPDPSRSPTPSARRSTVGSSSADKRARPTIPEALKTNSRSRSGSMLGRFSLGRKKEKNTAGAEEEDSDPEGQAYRHEESEPEHDHDGPDDAAATIAATASPSRFATALPTLGSFKGLSLSSGHSSTNYGSLADTPSASPSSSSPRRAVPPALKRHQTAPSPSSSSFSSNKQRLVEARWRFPTSDAGELALEKGDVVRVEEEVNADWLRGEIVSVDASEGSRASRVGQRGIFPASFTAPALDELMTGGRDWTAPSRRSQDDSWSVSAASTTSASTEDGDLSEDDQAKEGLRPNDAGGRSATGNATPRKAPPPPPPPARRRTGTVTRQLGEGDGSPFGD